MAKKTRTTLTANTPPPPRKYRFSGAGLNKAVRPIKPSTEPEPKEPLVAYTPKAKAEIDYLVAQCTQEVGFWGLVNNPAPGVYLIYKIYVPEQRVHGAETDISEDAMVALAEQIMEEGEDLNHLYFWGHSHVNMAVNPSGQDEDQTDEYLQEGKVFIRGIYNKGGASKVDVFDMTTNLVHTCVTETVAVLSKTDNDRLDKLIKENVLPAHVYTSARNTYGNQKTKSEKPGKKTAEVKQLPKTAAGSTKTAPTTAAKIVTSALNKAFGGSDGNKH